MPYPLIQQVIFLLLALTTIPAKAALYPENPVPREPVAQAADPLQLIESINQYFNNHYSYKADRDDLWLTRENFIKRGGGDCEDFALAKYQSLVEAGLPAADFRFVYALQIASGTAHIALIHQPTGKVLDSLTSETKSMNQRNDLLEKFQFTGSGFYPKKTQPLSRAELKTLQHWQAIIRKTEAMALKGLAQGNTTP